MMGLRLGGVDVGSLTRLITTDVTHGRPLQETQEFRVTPYLYRQIEESRAGADLPYGLSGTVLVASRIEGRPGELAQIHAFGLGLPTPNPKLSRDDWSALVAGMGLDRFTVLEFRFPPGAGGKLVGDAVKQLLEARRLFERGDAEEAVGRCRKALESVNPLVLDPPTGSPSQQGTTLQAVVAAALDAGSVGQTGKDQKSQRVLDIHAALWHFTHVGAHAHYHVSRNDAEYALWATSALIQLYAAALSPPAQ
jgi:hypothetical protein